MRRKDREMSREYGLTVIDRSSFGTVCLNDPTNPETPYAIPLSIVRLGEKLYFHSAKAGYKYEILQNNPPARVVFVDRVEVPNLFTDEDLQALSNQGKYSSFVSKIFTTEFSSAIVTGKVEIIDQEERPEEFRLAMRAICEKYKPDKLDYFETALDFSLDQLAVFSIEINSITAKRKKFDMAGDEMKWQRME